MARLPRPTTRGQWLDRIVGTHPVAGRTAHAEDRRDRRKHLTERLDAAAARGLDPNAIAAVLERAQLARAREAILTGRHIRSRGQAAAVARVRQELPPLLHLAARLLTDPWDDLATEALALAEMIEALPDSAWKQRGPRRRPGRGNPHAGIVGAARRQLAALGVKGRVAQTELLELARVLPDSAS